MCVPHNGYWDPNPIAHTKFVTDIALSQTKKMTKWSKDGVDRGNDFAVGLVGGGKDKKKSAAPSAASPTVLGQYGA